MLLPAEYVIPQIIDGMYLVFDVNNHQRWC